MAVITSAVKDGNLLIITYDDGVVVRRTIINRDTVVSTPPDGYLEVGNIYVNSSGNLIVNYNGSSIEIQTDDLTGAEVVTLLEALGVGSRLSHTRLDDVGTSDHHARYADTEADARVTALAILKTLFDANTILKADIDNSPEVLTVAEQRLVGRITDGVITGLTATQVATLIQASIDHGSIAGLGDDDHTQYQKESEKDANSGYAALGAAGELLAPGYQLRLTSSGGIILFGDRATENFLWFTRLGGSDWKIHIYTGGALREIRYVPPLSQGYQLVGTDLYVDDTAIGFRYVWMQSGYHIEYENTTGETSFVAN